MTMVAASCGGPRRIESRRCSSTTCAANGSRGRGSRRSDLAVRYRTAVTAAGVGHRVGGLPCVTNLGLLLLR